MGWAVACVVSWAGDCTVCWVGGRVGDWAGGCVCDWADGWIGDWAGGWVGDWAGSWETTSSTNNPRSPQCQTETQLLSSRPTYLPLSLLTSSVLNLFPWDPYTIRLVDPGSGSRCVTTHNRPQEMLFSCLQEMAFLLFLGLGSPS